DVTLPVLNELVNRRLLAYEDRHHTRRVELTQDVLVPVIKASRDSRLTREALAQAERLRAEQVAQRRKQRVTLVVACALAVALLATVWGGYYLFVQEHKSYFSEFTKRNGFPAGAIPISEDEARHHLRQRAQSRRPHGLRLYLLPSWIRTRFHPPGSLCRPRWFPTVTTQLPGRICFDPLRQRWLGR